MMEDGPTNSQNGGNKYKSEKPYSKMHTQPIRKILGNSNGVVSYP